MPGGSTHLDVLSEWIKSCDKAQHLPDCKSFIPTRLLLVGDESAGCVRLISNHGLKPESVKYIALSHRWGMGPFTKGKFVATTTDNIDTITSSEGIDDDFLPQTFLDAVLITRKLKVNYLWIDALCILQDNGHHTNLDSKQDWERESKLMEEVFGSAYLTIAASCAENRFQGFLKPRTQRQFVTMRTDDGVQFHICEIIDNFEADVEQGELNQRGWVLQERALSRRTLHFTRNQTYWECGEGIRCETLTKTTNRKAAFLADSNFPHSVESFKQGRQLQHYHDLYERYSSLGLTYETDKPRAIAGLEKRLMTALKSIGGYGVFESNFHRDLLWQRRNTGTSLRRIAFPPGERVPSWSWMAFDGEIRYMNVPFGDIDRATDITSPFERLSDDNMAGAPYLSGEAYFRARAHTLIDENPARLILDDPERIWPQPLMCVVIGTSKQHKNDLLRHYALIIAPIENSKEDKVFERVGVAYLSKEEVSIEEEAEFVKVQ
ncbi:hypothetical protein CORC01_11775 [Colletotrichum orchidophilum]|uniref:Heterokaryon incompatibility domain-containing protein n=1 Tax=Colletotrichum orchidophilum TaxID=1209926 RepID=A0A1G4AUS2_9PEZI|nr:uncharacterized protein CORC01_11775 [Colletotrichum orchidophilum]OHE92908.1 hypothetical protein CORC01_11775 [Colletotrichum orchidophilum]